MEYLSILISLITIVFVYHKFKNFELLTVTSLVTILGSAIIVMIFNLINNYSQTTDEEYRSAIVLNARYYEYWETWVEETCSRQVPCGESCTTDANGKQSCTTTYCTEYYDCSYCDHNNEYYEAVDNIGNHYYIDEHEYNYLTTKWKSDKTFIELNRRINKHNGCGVDGDAYEINWDNNVHRTETYNWVAKFTNRTKLNKSAFNYNQQISDSDAVKLGLYQYPKINNNKQEYLLGFDKIKNRFKRSEIDSIQNSFKYLNGNLGPKNKVHVFILLFYNKPLDIAFKQEVLWEGGNQNEIVVCVGLNTEDKKLKTDWVKAFSWTDNKKTMVDIREDIMECDSVDFLSYNNIITKAIINDEYHYKNLDKDFDYLDVDLSDGYILGIWLTVLVFNFIVGFTMYKNNL